MMPGCEAAGTLAVRSLRRGDGAGCRELHIPIWKYFENFQRHAGEWCQQQHGRLQNGWCGCNSYFLRQFLGAFVGFVDKHGQLIAPAYSPKTAPSNINSLDLRKTIYVTFSAKFETGLNAKAARVWNDKAHDAFAARLMPARRVTVAGPPGCEDRPWWWGSPDPDLVRKRR